MEFNKSDNRPKQVTETANFLNWTKKERPVNLTNYQVRVITAFNDQAKGPHFSKEYRQRMDQLPSVYKKNNGEFTAYASALPHHQKVISKNFSPAQRAAGKR